MEYIRAKWQYEGRQGKQPRLIVIHCTVSPESPTGAEAVANYFQRGERKASAHRVADNNSVVMCVPDGNTAFGAAGANSDGLHLELVGHATQTEREWLDLYSRSMMGMARPTIQEWSREYGIPLRWLTVAQVRDGVTKGLCTHADVSKAFPNVSTGHWDPGPGFPKVVALGTWTPHQPTPIPTPHALEADMFFARTANTLELFLFEPGRYSHIKSRADVDQIAANAGISKTEAVVSAATMGVLIKGRVKYA